MLPSSSSFSSSSSRSSSSSSSSIRRRTRSFVSASSSFRISHYFIWLVFLICSTTILLLPSCTVVNATLYTQQYYNATETYDFIDSYPSLPALFGRVLNPHVLYTGKLVFVQADPYLCGDNNDNRNRRNLKDNSNNIDISNNNNNDNHNHMNMNALNNNNNNNNQHYNHQSYDNAMEEEEEEDDNDSSMIILLAARGECPFQRKAVVAESYGPRVQFLIIYNYNSDVVPTAPSTTAGGVEDGGGGASNGDTLIPMYADAYGPGARTRLGLLSVTHRTGVALKRYIRDYQNQQQQQQQQEISSSENTDEIIISSSIIPAPASSSSSLSPPVAFLAPHDVDDDDDGKLLLDGPWLTLNADPPRGILTVQDLQTMLLTSLGLFFLLVSFTGCFLICAGTLSGAVHQHQNTNNNNINNNAGGDAVGAAAWRNAAPPHVLHLPPDLLETLQHDEEWQARFAQLAAVNGNNNNSDSNLSRDVSILAAMARGGRRGLQSSSSSSSTTLLTPDQVRRLAAASSAMSRRQQQAHSGSDGEADSNAGPAATTAEEHHAHDSSSSGSTNSSEAPCCAVCLDELDQDDDDQQQRSETVILPCHHAFHMHCIMPWLTERQAKCPLCKMDVLVHVLALDYIAQHAQQQQQQQRQGRTTAGQQHDDDHDDDEEEEQDPDALYHAGSYSPWRQFWQGFILVGPRRGGGGGGIGGRHRRRRHWTRVSTSLDHHQDVRSGSNSTIIAANEMISNDEYEQHELELVEATLTMSSSTRQQQEYNETATPDTADDAVSLTIQIV